MGAAIAGFSQRVARVGFDPARMRFALRTAIASCIALLIAWAIGLEHPQWAGMTVWVGSQMTRGLMLEKSFFRVVGTVVGACFGVLLMMAVGDSIFWLVCGIAIWVGICAWAGNLWRGLLAYGAILAGYTTGMVALLHTANPDDLVGLGIDRVLTALVGVAVALVIGLIFTPASDEDRLAGRIRRVSADMLRNLALRLSTPETAQDGEGDTAHMAAVKQRNHVISEIAGIEEMLENHAAGSLRSRRAVRSIRRLFNAQVGALLWSRRKSIDAVAVPAGIVGLLNEAAAALEAGQAAEDVIRPLARAMELMPDASDGQAEFKSILRALHDAVADWFAVKANRKVEAPIPARAGVILHRDWVGAAQAGMRAVILIFLVGCLWIAIDNPVGAYMVLGTTVMVSLFSTFDHPSWIMGYVFFGQVGGVIAATVCHWLLWPYAENELQMLFMLMPFVLLGVLGVSHRKIMPAGMDYLMITFLLSQPAYPLQGTFGGSVQLGLAVLVGPASAWLAFKYLFPHHPKRRLEMLVDAMMRELRAMARGEDVHVHPSVWRFRLYHRLLRLVRYAEKSGAREFPAMERGLMLLGLGEAILRLQDQLAQGPLSAAERRAITVTLARIGQIASNPARSAQTLKRAASRLAEKKPALAQLMHHVADDVTRDATFIREKAVLR